MPELTDSEIARIDSSAYELVGIVHGEGGPEDVARIVRRMDRDHLIGLAISCAAMVDPGKPLSQLLAWMTPADPMEGWTDGELKKAHADYRRGVRTPRVTHGQSIYIRMRKRRRAAAAATPPIHVAPQNTGVTA
ncbi:hypothetical protein [Cellulomonas sp. NPDC058312]|uniref:hypothetical protein n=1 Tax=Cellulomonas sp. NPDC058312 TaxID=3346441 RepID=UPI0036ED70B5